MSDNKPPAASAVGTPTNIATSFTATVAETETLKNASTKSTENTKPSARPKSKGFSNPALRSMGITTLRVPSRNWMIFWVTLAAGSGGIIYDRYQQKQIRKKWVNRVAKYGEQPLDPHTLARKITVYMAPPPGDYLDESMSVFRGYVKPILNSAGVDFNIQSENRQGVIRSIVAAEIRELRRQVLENEKEERRIAESKRWYNRLKNWLTQKKGPPPEEEQAFANKKFTDDLNFKNVVGVFYQNQRHDKVPVNEDAEISDPTANGGVLCIGRGAYKEYMHGIHEGLLGPLEKPIDHKEMEEHKEEIKTEKSEDEQPQPPIVHSLDDIENKGVKNKNETSESSPSKTTEPLKTDDKLEETDDDFDKGEEDSDKNLKPIPKPFIAPEDYSNAKLAPEFEFSSTSKIPTKDHVAPVFQQPILVIPVLHLLGFMSTPQRIYRFYTRRHQTEEYGKATVALVENLRSPFKLDHVDLAKEEEKDWPKSWVEKGKAKNSEWTQELVTDERILSKLFVYDADKVSEPSVTEN